MNTLRFYFKNLLADIFPFSEEKNDSVDFATEAKRLAGFIEREIQSHLYDIPSKITFNVNAKATRFENELLSIVEVGHDAWETVMKRLSGKIRPSRAETELHFVQSGDESQKGLKIDVTCVFELKKSRPVKEEGATDVNPIDDTLGIYFKRERVPYALRCSDKDGFVLVVGVCSPNATAGHKHSKFYATLHITGGIISRPQWLDTCDETLSLLGEDVDVVIAGKNMPVSPAYPNMARIDSDKVSNPAVRIISAHEKRFRRSRRRFLLLQAFVPVELNGDVILPDSDGVCIQDGSYLSFDGITIRININEDV